MNSNKNNGLTVLGILDVKHHSVRQYLDFTVEVKKGVLEKGKLVFLKFPILGRDVYVVKSVKKPLFSRKYIVRAEVAGLPEWAKGRFAEGVKENLGKNVFCGISFIDFQKLSRREKEEYYEAFVSEFVHGDLQQYYLNNIRTGIRLVPVESTDNFLTNKIGGYPMADDDFIWPDFETEKTFLFIGQINVREISTYFCTASDIGFDGMLYFFGSVNDTDGYLSFEDIIIKSSAVPLSPMKIDLPEVLEKYGVFIEKSLQVAELVTVPADESCLHDYGSIFSDEAVYTMSVFKDYECPGGINLIGHPEQVQGCILLDTELLNRKLAWYNPSLGRNDQEEIRKEMNGAIPDCKDWRLIFSIDTMDYNFRKLSKSDKEFNKHMDGLYNIMIREEDLENGNFENIQTVYTCT